LKSKENLPTSWVEVKFGELFSHPDNEIVDGPFGSNLKSSEYVSAGVPIARLQNIDRNIFVTKNMRYVTSKKADELARHTFIPGDMLITKLGYPLGKCCLAPASITRGVLVADVVRARITHQWVDPRFLCYQINSDEFVEQFKDQTKGTTRPRVNLTKIRTLNARLCGLQEQTQIVEKVEQLLSHLDAGVNELKAAQKKLGQYRQSLLKAAVEGELTADWRSKNKVKETGAQLLQRILKERRTRWETKQLAKYKEQNKVPPAGWKEKYPEPIKPFITDLPKLPEGWTWTSVEQLCTVLSGFAYKSTDFCSAGVPVTKIANVGYGTYELDTTQEFLPKSFLQDTSDFKVFGGDILIALTRPITNGILKSCVYPEHLEVSLLNQRVAALKAPPSEITNYFYLLTRSPFFREKVRSSTSETLQPNMSPNALKAISLPLPPLNEALELVERVNAQLLEIDDLDVSIKKELKQSAAQRKKILKAAFSGQLVPQNPNDEPASILLERIRVDRRLRTVPTKKSNKTMPISKISRSRKK